VLLVGVDGSPTSLQAAAYAAGLARRQQSRLVAVYVTTPPSPLTMQLPDTGALEIEGRAELADELAAAARPAPRPCRRRGVLLRAAARPAPTPGAGATEVQVRAQLSGSTADAGDGHGSGGSGVAGQSSSCAPSTAACSENRWSGCETL
jgi:nucleotide-binding universal stress UspA family protein